MPEKFIPIGDACLSVLVYDEYEIILRIDYLDGDAEEIPLTFDDIQEIYDICRKRV